MKANLLKFSIVLITATLLLAPAFAGADVFMKEKQHTDGMTIMGQAQPAQDRTVTTWITQDKMRRDEGEMSSLAIVEKGKMVVYHINHPQKLYTEMSLGSDDIQELASGMSGEIKVKVTPTGESKKIGNGTRAARHEDVHASHAGGNEEDEGPPRPHQQYDDDDAKCYHENLSRTAGDKGR